MTALEQRIAALLGDGYFPVQLPPPFVTKSFRGAVSALNAQFLPSKIFQSECETFSVARGGHRRRTTKLPNPVSQFLLARCIADNWNDIAKHLKKSKLSLTNTGLRVVAGQRSIEIPSFGKLESERVTRSSGYRFALVSDVTQFFPSLYTHALPWALHTKTATKAALAARPRVVVGYGDDLDKHVRNCQSQQTIGVPIGPDTSHILAEIVGVGIDLEVKKALEKWPAGYRYVDDFVLFFTSRVEADEGLSVLNQAMAHFELRPNENKTRVVPIDELEMDTWAHELRHFGFSHTKSRQSQELHHFFQLAFSHANKFPSESVMKFALRRVAVELIRKENWSVFESYLLRVANTHADTLQLVAQFLHTYKGANYPIDLIAVRRTLEALLREHVPFQHHSEIAWTLWIAIQNNVKVSRQFVQPIASVRSSVCALLLMHLHAAGLVAGHALSTTELTARCSAVALNTENWLLAYQSERDHLFPSMASFVAGHSEFGVLLANGLTFYDRSATQSPLFTVKDEDDEFDSGEAVFDQEENPNSRLNFSDVDEEYIDW